jgi:hypothetical protein
VAGSNRMNAEEVVDAMQLILGNVVRNAKIFTTTEIIDDKIADLFVCATTQAAELAKRVPANKMIVLDLQPTSQFFVEVARIPAGQDVYIFNSNSRYGERLVDSCRRVGIREVNFKLLGYEEITEEQTIAALRQAKWHCSAGRRESTLSSRYAEFLQPDVHITGIYRVASMQSACMLIQWVASYFHQAVTRQVSLITNKLRAAVIRNHENNGAGDLSGVANELDRLLTESNQSILTMHDAVMKSFANQISPNITMVDTQENSANLCRNHENSSNMEIVQTLENISALSEKCQQLSRKVDKYEKMTVAEKSADSHFLFAEQGVFYKIDQGIPLLFLYIAKLLFLRKLYQIPRQKTRHFLIFT